MSIELANRLGILHFLRELPAELTETMVVRRELRQYVGILGPISTLGDASVLYDAQTRIATVLAESDIDSEES